MGLDSATTTTASLAPGFRFHPTDEELVRYYLKRKVCGKSFRFDAISELDIYKSEPWDLPGRSRLKSRDLEWYFFSALDKKYGNGSRTNRATDQGYWKTTGKDRAVGHNSRTVGMKKTLVFHIGRAPRGDRTNWVMHEYRLVDEELEKSGIVQDAFVLCRIFQKSGTGPKNGEQYGAPFIEEEWDDDEVVMVPGENAVAEVVVNDDLYFDPNELEQNLDIGIPSENAPLPSNFYYGDSSNYVEDPRNFIEGDQKHLIVVGENHCGSELPDDQSENAPVPVNFYYGDSSNYVEDPRNFIEDVQKHLIGVGKNHCGPELPDDQNCFVLPQQYEMDTKSVKDDYPVEPSNIVNPVDEDYLLDEPYLDATDIQPFDDGLFLETNDLSDPNEADPEGFAMFEEYLAYLDADDNHSQNTAFDSSEVLGIENPVFEQASLTQKHVNGGIEQVSTANQRLEPHVNDGASSSKQTPEATKFESDIQYPFFKQASRMLGSIPAPPAFASEFPTKDAVLRLNSAAQSSGSVHFTAGVIQISNMTLTGNRTDWSFGKDGAINILLSRGLPQGDVNSASLEPMASILSGKTGSAASRCWFYFIFFWVLIFSVTFKIGSYICTR